MSDTMMAPVTTEDLHTMVQPSVPCDYITDQGDPCPREAEWIVNAHDHCILDKITFRMFCDPCLEELKAGDEWFCVHCHNHARAIDTVVSIVHI